MLTKLAQLTGPTRMSLIRLRAAARFGAGELTAVYLGNGRNLIFLRDLFMKSAEERILAMDMHPLAGRGALSRAADGLGADLLLSELPPLWAWRLPRQDCLHLPAWVRQELSLPTDPSCGRWVLPRSVEREADRLIRRHGYEMDFTGDESALRLFFRDFYRPYVSSRFGAGSFVDREGVFMERCRGQTLARLHSHGQWVAGLLLKRRGRHARFGRFGAISSPPPPGASEVLDTLAIRRLYADGVRHVVMGDSRPCLTDGVVRYKARFGATLAPTLFPQPMLCIEVLRWGEAVTEALRAQPLVSFQRGRAYAWRVHGEGAATQMSLEP